MHNPCLKAASFSRLIGSVLFAVASLSTHAALVVYEPFTNAPGTAIVGSGGGLGFANTWQLNGGGGTATNTASGLSYTDGLGNTLVNVGGAGFFQGATAATTASQPNRDLASVRGTNGVDGTSTWISFLVLRLGPATNNANVPGNPYPRGANLSLFNTGTEKFATGNPSTAVSNTIGIFPTGIAGNLKATSVTFTQVSFVVLRIDHVSSALDNAYLFLNPSLAAEPALGTATTNSLGVFDFTFNRIRPFAGGQRVQSGQNEPYAEIIIDEIRMGESWSDVTPYVPAGGVPPGMAVNLSNQVAQLCASASFFVNATGTPPLNYFWFANNAPAGGNSNSLVLHNLSMANAGNYFVLVTNAAGAVTSSVVTLSLGDTTVPSISQCATNQSLLADGSCQAQIPSVVNQVAASDCSGIASITQSPVAGTLVGTGPHVVTLTVTDGSNNVANCQATINVIGSGAPVILSCAPNQFLNANFNQQAAIPNLASLVVASNSCGSVVVTQSPMAGTIVGPGTNAVTLTAVGGSSTSNCIAFVIVNARPVAANQSVSTPMNTATNLSLGGSDADNGSLTFVVVSNPTNGTLGTLTSNLVTYTPNASFSGADAFTFVVHDGSATSAVATVSITVLNNEIFYPSTFQVFKGGGAVLLEDYATLPLSGRGGSITSFGPNVNFADQLARPTFVRSEPPNAPLAGARFFVTDLNRNLYILDKSSRTFTAYLNFQAIFPKYFNSAGFAGGLNPIAFDPEYATNGIFYTAHLENPGVAGSAAPVSTNQPGLDLTGYTTTTRIGPPAGTAARESVLVEWRDTNVNNNTFEGTAREIMRIGLNSQIHPLGDLMFNPLATPGHSDYRNLYLAVGDGSSGETAGATRTTPQRLDAIQGKILRITPDINLRPADELSANTRYRIPTTGADPNPFVSLSLSGLKKEIFAYGFRNCHRFSWDIPSNRILELDIGLNSWEEVNIVEKGINYGYSEREGTEQLFVCSSCPGTNGLTGSQIASGIPFPASDLLTVTGLVSAVTPVYPVAQYSHRDGDGISSGFVYRGSLMPALYGKFIFGDIANGRIFYSDYAEMQAAHDGNRNTVAPTYELQVVYNHPNDNPDLGLTRWRIFDIVAVTYTNRGGSAGGRLPGSAESTGPGKMDADGLLYGSGRADLRIAHGGDGEIYVITKSDGSIRKMTASLGAPIITSVSNGGGNVTLTWTSVPGWKYRVQYKTNVGNAVWSDIAGDVTAGGLTASKTTAIVEATRFYRVKWVP